MRNISGKKVIDKSKIHKLYVKYFFSENRAVYEIMCKNIAQPDRPQMPI